MNVYHLHNNTKLTLKHTALKEVTKIVHIYDVVSIAQKLQVLVKIILMCTILTKTVSLGGKITYFYDNKKKSFKMWALSHSHFPWISRNTFPLSHSCIERGKYNCSPDQMHSTTRQGAGWGSSEIEKWAMRLKTIQTKHVLRNVFRRQYILVCVRASQSKTSRIYQFWQNSPQGRRKWSWGGAEA